ncbi:MAG TPA: DUF1223 domain-containing protein [Bryobacteraceae bacterium]|jgi:hypothetical protein
MRILLISLAAAVSVIAADVRTPVLVELFTSEGCNSCPPADKFLQALEQRQPVKGVNIIILSEHVDYFDGEGWRDPFGSPQFTNRQRDYELSLKGDADIFTPQMFVNGKSGFVGSKFDVGLREIAKGAGRPVAAIQVDHVNVEGNALTASISIPEIPEGAGKGPFDVTVAVSESGLHSTPTAGENRGVAMVQAGVVRWLKVVGKATAAGYQGDVHLKLDHSWKRDSLKLVVFLSDRKTRAVWGATQTDATVLAAKK